MTAGTLETIIVIAKAPIPGRVKTRLIGTVTAAQAAELARAALLDTMAAVERAACRRRVLLLQGEPTFAVPAEWQLVAQTEGGLDRRLAHGFTAVGPGPVMLVGMDTPQLQPEQLGFDYGRFDAALGLATDGGFWTIGFRDPTAAAGVIEGVPMSQPGTGAEQLRRLRSAGLAVARLPELTDIDTGVEAELVAAGHPELRFSQQWREIRGDSTLAGPPAAERTMS